MSLDFARTRTVRNQAHDYFGLRAAAADSAPCLYCGSLQHHGRLCRYQLEANGVPLERPPANGAYHGPALVRVLERGVDSELLSESGGDLARANLLLIQRREPDPQVRKLGPVHVGQLWLDKNAHSLHRCNRRWRVTHIRPTRGYIVLASVCSGRVRRVKRAELTEHYELVEGKS